LDYIEFFRNEYLTREDLISFATSLQYCQTELGITPCWCLRKLNSPALEHFTCSHPSRPLYKGRDARPLALALVNQFAPAEDALIIRKHLCGSVHCINPSHYLFGTREDVWIQSLQRKGQKLTLKTIEDIRTKRESDKTQWTYEKLGKHFKLPYHVIRRICTESSYKNV